LNSKAESWGINKKFLRLTAKSIRQAAMVEFTEDDTDILVIGVNDYIQGRLQDISEERIEGIKLDERTLPKDAKTKELSPEEDTYSIAFAQRTARSFIITLSMQCGRKTGDNTNHHIRELLSYKTETEEKKIDNTLDKWGIFCDKFCLLFRKS
jgi:hypothetical protein